jgi:hypothetical protein
MMPLTDLHQRTGFVTEPKGVACVDCCEVDDASTKTICFSCCACRWQEDSPYERFFAAAIAIELAVIIFHASWRNGFSFSNPGGGWEFPFLWGLVVFAIALRGGGPYSLDRKLGWEL